MPKISELTNLSSVEDNDILAVVDDTDNATKKSLLSTLATYVGTSSAIANAVSNNVRVTTDSVASGSITLAYPSEVSFQLWDISGANSSNTATLPNVGTLNFFIIYNNSATDTLDIVRAGTNLFRPSGNTSVTLAANGVGFYIADDLFPTYITLN